MQGAPVFRGLFVCAVGLAILRRMESLRRRLRGAKWSLPLARAIAEESGGDKVAVRALVRELFGEDIEVRKRAADVARRITETDGSLLERYADELAGLLETLPVEESRTRWHLGLVVPRVACTCAQRLRVADGRVASQRHCKLYRRQRLLHPRR